MNELTITIGWVAAAVGAGERTNDAGQVVRDVVTDSRSLQAGDLFVALRGPRFDGHSFVEDVLGRGAVAAIVEKDYAGSTKQDPAYGSRPGPTASPGWLKQFSVLCCQFSV